MLRVVSCLALSLLLMSACQLDRSGLGQPDAMVTGPDDAALDAPEALDADRRDAPMTDAPIADDAPMAGDGGPAPTDLYDLDWGAVEELPATVDPQRCETDPVVTTDLAWLYLSRQNDTADGCYGDRRFHVFEWNDGSPTYVRMLPRFDATLDESNAHPVDGALFGAGPGTVLFLYQANGTGIEDIMWVELRGMTPSMPAAAPALVMSGAAGPTLTADGRRMMFVQGVDFLEVDGTPPDTWGASTVRSEITTGDRQGDPALSADGRVVVYFREETGVEPDLWVARRHDPSGPFESPARLPAPINSSAAEMDSFLTASGDLLFVSSRGDGVTRRVFLARRVAP